MTAATSAPGASAGSAGNEPSKAVLILGDSLTAGFGVDPDEAFPALLQEKVREAGMPFKTVNGGVSGDTSAGGLRRINWLLRRPIDVLVIALGGNDGLRGIDPGTLRTNLQQIVDRTRSKYPRARVVVAGMRMPDNLGEEFTRDFAKVYRQVAGDSEATLIPFLLEGVGGEPSLNQPDMIHPNAAGHRAIANHVWPLLRPVMESALGDPDSLSNSDSDGSGQ
jgi:acyl-CoA thioesterase-1